MARISGIDIPSQKRVVIALTYIQGIGNVTSKRILEKAKIDESLRAEKLTEADVARIREAIEAEGIKVEGDLRRDVQSNIKRLKDLGTFRGQRHIRRLPCRGQRTHTNARTAKGRKRIAIANKKQAPKK